MDAEQLEKLKYPIGKYAKPENFAAEKDSFIDTIASFPLQLADALASMTEAQIDTPYRPDGWTIRQVAHHCADSHINAFTRFKLTLTEQNPTVKSYEEQLWALGADYTGDVNTSIGILKNLHKRWVQLLQSMTPEQYERTYTHPQTGKQHNLAYMLSLYSWHCKHHLGHVFLVKNK
jgi:hypothetical protein